MSTMNMPGFTAEESLYNSNLHYQVTAEVSVYTGNVQPAFSFGDLAGRVFDPGYFFPLFPCVKTRCFPGTDICVQLPGYYNYHTQTCE